MQEEKEKIILIEDQPRDRIKISNLIEDLGFSTIVASSDINALKIIKQENVPLIIANFNLIDPSGLDFLRAVKEAKPEVEVLFISEKADVEMAVESIKIGALDFIKKPLLKEKLNAVFFKIFNKKENQQEYFIYEEKDIITQNKKFLDTLELSKKIAKSNASVLIQGESGTGKELFARYIHENSPRKDEAFVAINCAVLPENLLESELFGHEKGSFTGAYAKKAGKFEIANKGTILLDEITEMQISLQAKLLRVLQEREIERVGGNETIKVDIRIIATTNRNIEESIEKGEFREDLFYRLNIIPLKIIPLRERKDDIEILCKYFIEKHKQDSKKIQIRQDALHFLENLDYKGNVRELENIIQRATLLTEDCFIKKEDLMLETYANKAIEKTAQVNISSSNEAQDASFSEFETMIPRSLKEIEKQVILKTLSHTNGNRSVASEILGINVRTLRNKLKEYKESKDETF